MKLTESKLRKIIRKSLLEYGAGPEFDHLRDDVDNLTDEDMKAIADRFCQFVSKQDFEYINFRSVYHENDSYTFKDGEAIIIEAIVETNTWKRVQKQNRRTGRKYYADAPVMLLDGQYLGIIPEKLFQGTKYLQGLKTSHKINRTGQTSESYTSLILLHWRKYTEPSKRKLVYQELKDWLDQNENKQFSREDFGFPPVRD
jgi:hypothetical protein